MTEIEKTPLRIKLELEAIEIPPIPDGWKPEVVECNVRFQNRTGTRRWKLKDFKTYESQYRDKGETHEEYWLRHSLDMAFEHCLLEYGLENSVVTIICCNELGDCMIEYNGDKGEWKTELA